MGLMAAKKRKEHKINMCRMRMAEARSRGPVQKKSGRCSNEWDYDFHNICRSTHYPEVINQQVFYSKPNAVLWVFL
jgi:hypothetical protein